MLYIIIGVDWDFCDEAQSTTIVFQETLLISSPLGLGTKNETSNILALGCLGHVEPNIVMIVPIKPLVKLRFGFDIMP